MLPWLYPQIEVTIWLRLYLWQFFSWSIGWVEGLFVQDVCRWICVQIWSHLVNATKWRSSKCVDDVWSHKMGSRMEDHGLSRLRPDLLQGHDDYDLWHVIWRHKSSMHHVEEVEYSCWEERIRYTHFQGVQGRWCTSKLECCLHCLWDWRSYDENGWQRAYVFFPLNSIFQQTYQAVNRS